MKKQILNSRYMIILITVLVLFWASMIYANNVVITIGGFNMPIFTLVETIIAPAIVLCFYLIYREIELRDGDEDDITGVNYNLFFITSTLIFAFGVGVHWAGNYISWGLSDVGMDGASNSEIVYLVDEKLGHGIPIIGMFMYYAGVLYYDLKNPQRDMVGRLDIVMYAVVSLLIGVGLGLMLVESSYGFIQAVYMSTVIGLILLSVQKTTGRLNEIMRRPYMLVSIMALFCVVVFLVGWGTIIGFDKEPYMLFSS